MTGGAASPASSAGGGAAALSSRVAAGAIGELVLRGVRDVVVCPGSRSQALALAAAEAERRGAVRLHVCVDERSAAYFALGIGRETGVPAVVVVTSGTAVGNLMPAVLEASHARVPVILLSADRPPELHGVRANQTLWNSFFLAEFSRYMVDVPAVEEGEPAEAYLQTVREIAAEAYLGATEHLNGPGPAHLNIGFRDPLSGGDGGLVRTLAGSPVAVPPSPAPPLRDRRDYVSCARCGPGFVRSGECRHRRCEELDVYVHGDDGAGPRAVVIAGADAGPAAAEFAHAAGLPLLAEPSSGARYGREAIQHWEQLLAVPETGDAIERVIVFGNPTLTRAVPALVQRAGVETVVVDPAGPDGPPRGIERFNPGLRVGAFALRAEVAAGHDAGAMKPWLGEWVVRDRALREETTTMHAPDLGAARAAGYRERNAYARAEVAALREAVTREHLTEAVWLATWPHDRLVVAASRLIRVLNRTAAPRNIRVHANRGLSGIDGTVATALGIAVASQAHESPAQAAGTTRVLIGDLALLHDAGSLLLPASGPDAGSAPRPRIQLFVGNDGGGTIFDTLEAAETARDDDFDRVMYTPQNVELHALAEAYGWAYERVENRGRLDRLLTAPVTGPMLVEIPLAR
ncbi:2-succinyl-5-enolpyruvyl-6-hydroxy-3-cyclohexene-1-carboxylic-acid synthase [Leucobacter weissii]|uniref:2-succinyl-5-enolpyruvyl-6-hydroxy-3-cyclohexene-1-carboxylate synthase n=1 Tax=Leucobacter weissii TaxID=1983706 RepID=A0A939MMM9_9MICO|nr:2-succinyl-5-enolpyruvyl-6-hydroxy-3-cyclohexene-1-carboxylic-acid synthase [Leucobacter weissii]MBO1901577.1 2-succinyl-5-enolpyruvyl-6-hydroxy-3-cyclohexene-1-carboxylic-acid synthase [Leucobacter weissii]